MMIKQQGFTLIEVLVALFILASLAVTSMQVISNATEVRLASQAKSFAQLCADNLLVEQLLVAAWPEVGRQENHTKQGAVECFWRIEVEATPLPAMRRIHIEVFPDIKRHRVLAQVTGFVGK